MCRFGSGRVALKIRGPQIRCVNRVLPLTFTVIRTYDRWIDHYSNRIAYEKAMLGETGGLAADRFNFEVGGKVFIGDEWLVILKINKTGDAISSLTTTPRRNFYGSKYKADIESVDVLSGTEARGAAAVKAASRLPRCATIPATASNT